MPKKPLLGQESLILEGVTESDAHYISTNYSLAQAELAAKSRRKRQGKYALNLTRCAGFLAASKSMFVPHSRSEMQTVISGPITNIHDALTKFRQSSEHWGKSDEEREEALVKKRLQLWSQVGNFRRWQTDAYKHKGMLERGLTKERVPSLEAITEDEICMRALTSYLVTLNSFAGNIQSDNGKTRWVQANWTTIYNQEIQAAEGYLSDLSSGQLFAVHREALFGEWSRGRYWSTQLYQVKKSEQEYQATEPDYVQVPIHYYQ